MDKRVRFTTETRIEAAKLFDAGFGVSMVATHLDMSAGTLRDWRDLHRQGALLGLGVMSGLKSYSADLKVAAVEMFLSGVAKSDVLLEFGISSRGLFNRWVIAYRKDGPAGLVAKPKGRRPAEKRVAEQTLEERVAFLEMENEVLKKLQALMFQQQALKKKR